MVMVLQTCVEEDLLRVRNLRIGQAPETEQEHNHQREIGQVHNHRQEIERGHNPLPQTDNHQHRADLRPELLIHPDPRLRLDHLEAVVEVAVPWEEVVALWAAAVEEDVN